MLTITHDRRVVEALSDRVMILRDGGLPRKGGVELAKRFFFHLESSRNQFISFLRWSGGLKLFVAVRSEGIRQSPRGEIAIEPTLPHQEGSFS